MIYGLTSELYTGSLLLWYTRTPWIVSRLANHIWIRYLLIAFEKVFDLPVSFVADYVCDQMRKEVDLANEARNAEKTARYLATEPALKDKCMVPKVHWPYTGTAVMTAEFIKAVQLTDVEGLKSYNLAVKPVMDNVIALFAAMTFKWGWVSHYFP